jgi:transcription elongation factor GreA
MAPTFLTQEGYDRLQDELDYLRGDKRLEIASRLREAMEDGELIENAEYEAAKNEQAFIEGRIIELEILLAKARVVDDTEPVDSVRVGATVTIQEDGDDPETYYIVGPPEAAPREGKISNESPLGRALYEQKIGDIVEVNAPDGSFTVKILDLK